MISTSFLVDGLSSDDLSLGQFQSPGSKCLIPTFSNRSRFQELKSEVDRELGKIKVIFDTLLFGIYDYPIHYLLLDQPVFQEHWAEAQEMEDPEDEEHHQIQNADKESERKGHKEQEVEED